jgi:hypothetical protein
MIGHLTNERVAIVASLAVLAATIALLPAARTIGATPPPAASRFTVAPQTATPIEIQTFADALCTIRGAKPSKGVQAVAADDRGVARFFITPKKASSEVFRLTLSCKAGKQSADYPIDLVAGSTPTAQMPAPTHIAAPIPADARIRPALNVAQIASMSDEALLKGGYPMRPDAAKYPTLYKGWLKAVSVKAVVLPPRIVANPYTRMNLDVSGPSRGAKLTAARTSNIWSGAEMVSVPGSFAYVQGDWIVPAVHSKGDIFSTQSSSIWVGIDGAGTLTDLVQAGSEQMAQDIFWAGVTTYQLWTEFLPQQPTEQIISRIAIEPGDDIFTQVSLADSATGLPKSSGKFGVFVVQSTPPMGLAYVTTVLTPVGTTVVPGSRAEWIMERPSTTDIFGKTTPLDLANYGSGGMTDSIAAKPVPPGGVTVCCDTTTATNITMLNRATGRTLSTTRLIDTISQGFTWVNYN